MTFCKELKGVCNDCWENSMTICTVKLGSQDYFPKDFKIYDTIHIVKDDKQDKYSIETDIEVKYNTQYPYGSQAGKGAEFAVEYSKKDKLVRDYLTRTLPSDVNILHSHQHYKPDKYNPKVVAQHIHVHARADNLTQAKDIVRKLVGSIVPKQIEEMLKEQEVG